MHWIAPSEKDHVAASLKKRLRDAAGRFDFGPLCTDPAFCGINYLWIQLFRSALKNPSTGGSGQCGRARFVMANGAKSEHPCWMKTAEKIRECSAEMGITEQEAINRRMEEKPKEFVKMRADVYTKA